MDLSASEQAEYASDLGDRITAAVIEAPAVCLLDTGVHRSHDLLEASIDDNDLHTIVGGGTGDREGHGTKMASLALLGPLEQILANSERSNLFTDSSQ